MIRREQRAARDGGAGSAVEEVVEVSFLLPGPLAEALERAALREGLTAGRLMRRILRGFLNPTDAGKADGPG